MLSAKVGPRSMLRLFLLQPTRASLSRTISQPSRAFHVSLIVQMPPKQKYSDPKLREEVKEEIKQSDKGGAPGQWSARKVGLYPPLVLAWDIRPSREIPEI